MAVKIIKRKKGNNNEKPDAEPKTLIDTDKGAIKTIPRKPSKGRNHGDALEIPPDMPPEEILKRIEEKALQLRVKILMDAGRSENYIRNYVRGWRSLDKEKPK
jgi:hypothetical protein